MPTEALHKLYASEDWPAFLANASKVRVSVDLQCLQGLRQQTLHEIDESFVDTRYDFVM